MPNWVATEIQIVAQNDEEIAELQRFLEHIERKPEFLTDDRWNGFTFHSFITLDPKHRDEYNEVNGWEDGVQKGQSPNNWYNWNSSNWNTKWDACEAHYSGSPNHMYIEFNTAWSPPTPIYEAMSRMFPSLVFEVRWEEEQGFGERLEYQDGSSTLLAEWDIPCCHSDYVDKGDEENCVCNWDEDKNNWFSDCPGKEVHKYTVEVVTKYVIKADSEERALEAAQAEEAGNDAIDNTEVLAVAFSDEYRIGHVEIVEENNE